MIINALTFAVIVLALGFIWHFLFLLTVGERLLGATAKLRLFGKKNKDGDEDEGSGFQPFRGLDQYPFIVSALLAAWVFYSLGVNILGSLVLVFPTLSGASHEMGSVLSGVMVALGAAIWERVILPRWKS